LIESEDETNVGQVCIPLDFEREFKYKLFYVRQDVNPVVLGRSPLFSIQATMEPPSNSGSYDMKGEGISPCKNTK
jgi:hypothetical protein